jgi:hypothetical protein
MRLVVAWRTSWRCAILRSFGLAVKRGKNDPSVRPLWEAVHNRQGGQHDGKQDDFDKLAKF